MTLAMRPQTVPLLVRSALANATVASATEAYCPFCTGWYGPTLNVFLAHLEREHRFYTAIVSGGEIRGVRL